MTNVVYEGWMVRYGRRKIGKSFIHMRYFVLETRLLAYYKKQPTDNMVPLQSLVIDGNCRVEDRGLKTQQGHMAAYNIQDALNWKQKIESVIDQQHGLATGNGNSTFVSRDLGMDIERNASSSSHERKSWDIWGYEFLKNFQELIALYVVTACLEISELQILTWVTFHLANHVQPRSYSKAMKAVGVVDATCAAIFELIMSMDGTRFEWDCSFQYGNLVEEVDGHTAVLYQRLQLEWCSRIVWPRDLCYVRYWRRNDDGSYVVLFQSREHPDCGPQPGFVRAHLESGGFKISPLKPRNTRPRTQVQHLMQINLGGWFVGYFPSFQQHCLLHMLSSVAGIRELFSQTDEVHTAPRIPIMVSMTSDSVSSEKEQKTQEISIQPGVSLDQVFTDDRHPLILDEDSDDDEDNHMLDAEEEIPAGKFVMELVAVDWLKNATRMDNVARRSGCAAQVASEKGLFSFVINMQIPGSTHYSLVFYYVKKQLEPGSLLQRFVDGDDEFRNSRFKLIPSVTKGSWIVRQSVGSMPCLLGKAVDCTYVRGEKYLEIDVDIGSSAVANGVLGLVFGVLTSLVVDMAFLIQAVSPDELPERLIGAVRIAHAELSSAVVADLGDHPSEE
ncbi:hypothetical protein OPV22_018842 [Ensete ventricosum]|uniref:START domain-containing protein n=1 Tax=Ensete ventricosum TaxID=4639 RepID=A0AAV8R479_ENSVE|nr:hypothetical protein OPV22_018842 [Ensete ventricosum]